MKGENIFCLSFWGENSTNITNTTSTILQYPLENWVSKARRLPFGCSKAVFKLLCLAFAKMLPDLGLFLREA